MPSCHFVLFSLYQCIVARAICFDIMRGPCAPSAAWYLLDTHTRLSLENLIRTYASRDTRHSTHDASGTRGFRVRWIEYWCYQDDISEMIMLVKLARPRGGSRCSSEPASVGRTIGWTPHVDPSAKREHTTLISEISQSSDHDRRRKH